MPKIVLETDDVQAALRSCSAVPKISWASRRDTTRIEDQAYYLLGIFEVSMLLLYGEGIQAFIKLQEEILRAGTDLSILAWEHDGLGENKEKHLFADLPVKFCSCNDIVPALPFPDMAIEETTFMINKGLQIDHPPIINFTEEDALSRYGLSLGCRRLYDPHGVLALEIQTAEASQWLKLPTKSNRRTYNAGWASDTSTDSRLIRVRFNAPSFPEHLPALTISKQPFLDKMKYGHAFLLPHEYLWIILPVLQTPFAWRAASLHPSSAWDPEALACRLDGGELSDNPFHQGRNEPSLALTLCNDMGESFVVNLKVKNDFIQFYLSADPQDLTSALCRDCFKTDHHELDISTSCKIEIFPDDVEHSGKSLRQLVINVHRKPSGLSSNSHGAGAGRTWLCRSAHTKKLTRRMVTAKNEPMIYYSQPHLISEIQPGGVKSERRYEKTDETDIEHPGKSEANSTSSVQFTCNAINGPDKDFQGHDELCIVNNFYMINNLNASPNTYVTQRQQSGQQNNTIVMGTINNRRRLQQWFESQKVYEVQL